MNVANSGVAMFGKGISQENIQLSFCMSSKGIFQETYSFQRNISRNVQLSKEYFKKRTAFKGIFQETYSFQRNISRNVQLSKEYFKKLKISFLFACLQKEHFKKRTAFKGIFQET